MNKQEFMDYLEKRLSVLNKREREDIIQEYSQHIDLKITSGLNEYEVIKEFGDPKAFADEILEAYNIDPEYEEEMERNNGKRNLFKSVKDSVSGIVEFILKQKPQVLFSMLIRIAVMTVILGFIEVLIFSLLAEFTDEILMYYLPESICWLFLLAYIIIAVSFAIYMLMVYIKKLTMEIKLNGALHRTSALVKIKKGVNSFADFIITQRPLALIVMLFKIFIMAVLLFTVGLIGMLIPTVIAFVTSYIVDINGLLYGLYFIIAFPVGIYILYCYTARLAHKMMIKNSIVKKESVPMDNFENNVVEVEPVQTDEVSGSEVPKQKSADVDKTATRNDDGIIPDESLLNSLLSATKTFMHLCWRAVCILFKFCVAAGLLFFCCMLLPVIFMTGAAPVFLILGYPAVGLFIIGMGCCISGLAFAGLIIKLVFMKNRVKEESV